MSVHFFFDVECDLTSSLSLPNSQICPTFAVTSWTSTNTRIFSLFFCFCKPTWELKKSHFLKKVGQFLHVRGFSLKWLKIRKIFSWKIPFSPNLFFAKLLGPELIFFSKMERKHALLHFLHFQQFSTNFFKASLNILLYKWENSLFFVNFFLMKWNTFLAKYWQIL